MHAIQFNLSLLSICSFCYHGVLLRGKVVIHERLEGRGEERRVIPLECMHPISYTKEKSLSSCFPNGIRELLREGDIEVPFLVRYEEHSIVQVIIVVCGTRKSGKRQEYPISYRCTSHRTVLLPITYACS